MRSSFRQFAMDPATRRRRGNPQRAPQSPADSHPEVVSRWLDAFNARDLGAMLALMDRRVLLQPLRLSGFDRFYQGHEGVRRWLARMRGTGSAYRFSASAGSVEGGEVLSVGELRIEREEEPVRGWMLHRVGQGQILSAHHYLTDPAAFPGPLPRGDGAAG